MVEVDKIKKILYITMSNLGDAVMGLPAFDFLRRECPQAKITVVAGPRTKCIFENHPDVHSLIVFNQNSPLREKIALFYRFKKEGFDCIVDLRNTFYRYGLKAAYKNPMHMVWPKWASHSSARHLLKAVAALRGTRVSEEEFLELNSRRNPSFITGADQDYVRDLLRKENIGAGKEFILVAPGARSSLKKWSKEGYAEVARGIREIYGYEVVVIGDKIDKLLVKEIVREAGNGVIDLAEKTDFGQVCALIQRAKIVICNDSGMLHIASYLQRPTIGIYGPTDYKLFGPWSDRRLNVHKEIYCAPCNRDTCASMRQCILSIRPYDVLLAVRIMLEGREASVKDTSFRRILIVRTDRMGDVLLSTPVIKSLRDNFPMSFIAMMVSVANKDLIDGNPYLDEVILFDKDKRDKGFFGTFFFSKKLAKFGFDLAIILHPSVRVHLICFLAGIKTRIGYDRKAPYFLTQAIPHKKQEGRKHEAEYNFDLLKPLGISAVQSELYMPVKEESNRYVEALLEDAGVHRSDTIVAVHPAASCISKRWPLERFAEVIDYLTVFHKVKVVVVAGAVYANICRQLFNFTKFRPVDFCGRLNLAQLASLLKRSNLLISNDSGPVHICVAVGTPVIAIFGRRQPGLGPLRWGPLGKSDVVLHKETDCEPCKAHDCTQNFKCLEAISVQDVLGHAGRILGERIDKNTLINIRDGS